ncbi:MAG: mercuric reductase [Nitrospirae bacterium]|nr:mercuric reductase [Candidatus Troglogloeales bacterium]MBI3598993.1 mercuric reductase [Candidatus Troglogloeales bacterium]
MTQEEPVWPHEFGVVIPDDEYNQTLMKNVHPPLWVNPAPSGKYNLVVIGAGTAGLVTASIAAALGAKVAMIERHLMGGDCLNVGCVPSKGIIRASRVWSDIRNAGEFGVSALEAVRYDFGTVMERMRRVRARISHVDSADRYRKMGVDLFIGEGRFTGPSQIEVAGVPLHFLQAAICTGARAAAPKIPGLKEAGYLTNETLFNLTQLPQRMAVIGGGPIGCEMAQCFARFGSDVALFEQGGHLLPREDTDAARIVQAQMMKEGVFIIFESKIIGITLRGGKKVIQYRENGEMKTSEVDEILVGIGRAPNVEGLGLETVGVEYDAKGVKVNDKLQTTRSNIYAAGDVCFPYKFTHTADATAQIVIQNALFPHPFGLGYATTDSLVIPWCTYTDPEIASVGINGVEASRRGVETFTYPLNEVDRAILNGQEEGFARIHVQRGTDTILGATIVAAHAGELISPFTLAMRKGLGLGEIAGTIIPYPTQAEVVKKVANAWRKSALTERKKKLLRRWFAFRR